MRTAGIDFIKRAAQTLINLNLGEGRTRNAEYGIHNRHMDDKERSMHLCYNNKWQNYVLE